MIIFCFGCSRHFDADWFEVCPGCDGEHPTNGDYEHGDRGSRNLTSGVGKESSARKENAANGLNNKAFQ